MDARVILRNTLLAAVVLLLAVIVAWTLQSTLGELGRLCTTCHNERVILVDDGTTLTSIPCEECEIRTSARGVARLVLERTNDVRAAILRWGRRQPEEAVFVVGSVLYLGSLLVLSLTRRCRACLGIGTLGGDSPCEDCGGLGRRTLMERLFVRSGR